MLFYQRFVLPLKSYWFYLSLLLGGAFALSVYSYWLIDFLPPTSRQVIFYTLIAGLMGTIGYYFLLKSCIAPVWSELTGVQQWVITGLSALLAGFLMLAGTNAWRSASRYITFLLPTQTLKVSVLGQQGSNSQISILRFTTSLGDVSYNTLKYGGWKRQGYQLILVDPANNWLEWTGQSGESATIVFLRRDGLINIEWNGENQTVELTSNEGDKYQSIHQFNVPLYASRSMVLFLVALNFFVVCLAVNFQIFRKREAVLADLRQSMSSANRREGQRRNILNYDWVVVAGLLIFALLLRIFNLENLDPYLDEYNHLLAAKAILNGASIFSVYSRSLWTVTLPAALFLRIFGMQLWAARLPGVFFNSLAVIPLFLIMRKINRPVAIISCVLYATSPWIIALARNLREYAYYPFYYCWILYGMVSLIESFPDRFVPARDLKKLKAGIWLLGLGLILPVVYGLLIDRNSTFKTILIAYLVCGVFLAKKFDLRSKSNLVLMVLAGIGIFGSLYLYASRQSSISSLPGFDSYVFRYFFLNPQQQWYFDIPMVIPVLALFIAALICVVAYRINFVPPLLVALYLSYLFFFTTFFARNVRPRYLVSVQLWYVMLLALGLYAVSRILRSITLPLNRAAGMLVPCLLILSMINSSQVLLPSWYAGTGHMPITEEIHYNVAPAYLFLLDKVKSEDVLIASVYDNYVSWKGIPKFHEIYSYNYNNDKPQDYVFSIIERYDSGWVVLDARNYSLSKTKPLPKNSVILAGKQVDYIGLFSDQYIWRWHTYR
ncbi:MAG TPA: glycosyltransferase family 39 protein [Anaerolineales bacterium]|nr:glycosyltransferase family 39 protein [Anaerolineales bacterium]